jgi:hypothetical protein
MLEKIVLIQVRRVVLKQITTVESMTDFFPLVDSLQEKEITIGAKPVPSAGRCYKEKFYIYRSLDKLLQQAENQRIMIIADKAGMVNSFLLTHLTERIKEIN